jgi:hypothetical protein
MAQCKVCSHTGRHFPLIPIQQMKHTGVGGKFALVRINSSGARLNAGWRRAINSHQLRFKLGYLNI